MRKHIAIFVFSALTLPVTAQAPLSLDSCRQLALANNKQLNIAKLKQDVALNTRRATRTKYLPKVDAIGAYEHISQEVSLLKDDQKTMLSNLGTTVATQMGATPTEIITSLVQQGVITPQAAQQLGGMLEQAVQPIAQKGNEAGQGIRDAFRTDTRNIWAGAILLRQPIYMGGAITAANAMADINEQMVQNDIDLRTQNTLYGIDQAYWLVVSLRQKLNLANSYRELVKKLDDDIHKMIGEGVATKADGLRVDVTVNEADMQATQAEDGLTLAKMLLCQLCGLPMNGQITLADENETQAQGTTLTPPAGETGTDRPEIRMLQNTIDLSRQTTKLVRAAYLPQVALTAGYLVANPNPFNGFSKEFTGAWNVGVVFRVPVWNWFEGRYKVNASKALTNIATLEKTDVEEKIALQVAQCRFKLDEARKKMAMTNAHVNSAEENLRCANLGFSEGVMNVTDVMAAQTAWQMAHTQRIDAQIDVILSQLNLEKALGKISAGR